MGHGPEKADAGHRLAHAVDYYGLSVRFRL
jgi:hypothetical protein